MIANGLRVLHHILFSKSLQFHRIVELQVAEKLTAKHNFLLLRADNRMIFVHCLSMYVCYTQFQGTLAVLQWLIVSNSE